MLTERELHVLYYMTKGYSNVEIGKVLFMSRHTAKAHVSSIIRKLNVKSRAEVTYIAAKENLLADIEAKVNNL